VGPVPTAHGPDGLHAGATPGWFHGTVPKTTMKGPNMLYTLVVILLVLWLLGMVGSFTLGGAIHLLLLVALVLIVVNLVQGRRVL
jgi:hypothetical protein